MGPQRVNLKFNKREEISKKNAELILNILFFDWKCIGLLLKNISEKKMFLREIMFYLAVFEDLKIFKQSLELILKLNIEIFQNLDKQFLISPRLWNVYFSLYFKISQKSVLFS